ncbi:MAG: hypothetical protein IPL78_05565 [Chloroflexi bacterium]|nr:hypothetical protein [Chloroflexota bacterium]
MNERGIVLRAAAIAALVAFVAVLVMGFGVTVPDPAVKLQPGPGPVAEFARATNEYPDQVLAFFAADSLFVLSYLLVFAGLYELTKGRGRVLAVIALGAGLLTALFDATENAHFITYALLAKSGVPLTDPAIVPIAILGNLKWLASFATLYAFGLIFPTEGWFNRTIIGLMLIFPIIGVLGVARPALVDLRGLFFLLGMPLFAWAFWRGRDENE